MKTKKTCQLPSYLKLRFIPKKLMILSVMEGYTFAESINVNMNRIERKYFNSIHVNYCTSKSNIFNSFIDKEKAILSARDGLSNVASLLFE